MAATIATGQESGSADGHVEDVAAPRRQVQIEAARLEVAAVAIVAGVAGEVLQPHRAAGQPGPGRTDVALAPVAGVVDGDEQAPAVRTLPGPGEEAIPGPVAVPGRRADERAPLAVADGGPAEHGEEPVVEGRED